MTEKLYKFDNDGLTAALKGKRIERVEHDEDAGDGDGALRITFTDGTSVEVWDGLYGGAYLEAHTSDGEHFDVEYTG